MTHVTHVTSHVTHISGHVTHTHTWPAKIARAQSSYIHKWHMSRMKRCLSHRHRAMSHTSRVISHRHRAMSHTSRVISHRHRAMSHVPSYQAWFARTQSSRSHQWDMSRITESCHIRHVSYHTDIEPCHTYMPYQAWRARTQSSHSHEWDMSQM